MSGIWQISSWIIWTIGIGLALIWLSGKFIYALIKAKMAKAKTDEEYNFWQKIDEMLENEEED